MPVRFRCDHCGQLLAIARRKRGTSVECPRCQNALLVPDTDRIDRPKPSTSARLFESNEFDRWLGKSAEFRGKEAGQSPLFDIAEIPEEIVLEEEAETPSSSPSLPLVASAPSSVRRLPQGPPIAADRRFRLLLLIAAISICLAFFLGLIVGRFVFAKESSTQAAVKKGNDSAQHPAAAEVPVAVEEAGLPATTGPSLGGKLQFRDENIVHPDSGASVIVLPADLELSEKIPIDGLRPEDQAHQHRPGAQRLREHGGAFGCTDGEGSFHLELPGPGKFWVLTLSNHRPRADLHPVFPADRSVLSRYFADPAALLDGRDYLLISRQVPQGPAQPIVHSF